MSVIVPRTDDYVTARPVGLWAAAREAGAVPTLSVGSVAAPERVGVVAVELLRERMAAHGSEAARALLRQHGAELQVWCDWRETTADDARDAVLDALQATGEVRDELAAALDPALVLSLVGSEVARRLLGTADTAVAMHLEAVRGELGAFDDRLHSLGRPYPGQITAARNVRTLLAGSEFTTERGRESFGGDHGARVQDAISLRAVPQTHGAVRDALSRFQRGLDRAVAAGGSDAGTEYALLHELLGTALIDLANISQHRSYRLLDSRATYGLPMNLMGENAGYNHGFPIVHTSAIAILAEMKLHAPRSFATQRVDQVTGRVRSFSFQAAQRTLLLLDYLQKVLSIEVFMSAQAMDLAERVLTGWRFGAGTAAAHAAVRGAVPYIAENRFASDDMTAVEALMATGALSAAVTGKVGSLD